jgi:spore coat polysaccharide biosynthesis predicted glycosyltransferase SpsG
MINRLVIFPGIYSKSGIGNVYRMISLAKYLRSQNKDLEIDFVTKDKKRIFRVSKKNEFNLINFNELKKSYDVALYDSSRYEKDVLSKLRNITNRIIAFDFFNYDSDLVDEIINLYNHFPERVDSFCGKLYTGLDYAILSEKILISKSNVSKTDARVPNSFLITFGGEDPNGNTLNVLRTLYELNLNGTVLIGKFNNFNKEIQKNFNKQFKILHQVSNIEDYYSVHDCIICGGGTTLLEALYLGKPTIALPQNFYEANFIDYIKQSIKIFSLDEIMDVIRMLDDNNTKILLSDKYKSFIDGKGKERISKIIL